jgi:hypothetical protein
LIASAVLCFDPQDANKRFVQAHQADASQQDREKVSPAKPQLCPHLKVLNDLSAKYEVFVELRAHLEEGMKVW